VLIPKQTPQFFYEAVSDYLAALNVSIDRIAPFAGLHPEQLRRLGKDSKHWTLAPAAIAQLIDAGDLVGYGLAADVKETWEKHLKVASLYTILVIAAYRRTDSAWPGTPEEYQLVWEMASNFAIHSAFAVYHADEDNPNPEMPPFAVVAEAICRKWSQEPLETEDELRSTLAEINQVWKDSDHATFFL
jgi:hypothetical protein